MPRRAGFSPNNDGCDLLQILETYPRDLETYPRDELFRTSVGEPRSISTRRLLPAGAATSEALPAPCTELPGSATPTGSASRRGWWRRRRSWADGVVVDERSHQMRRTDLSHAWIYDFGLRVSVDLALWRHTR